MRGHGGGRVKLFTGYLIDLIDSKLEMATTFGATHTINASKGDGIAEVMEICPNGVDLSIEATGRPAVMATALTAVRAQGGRAVVIGKCTERANDCFGSQGPNQGKSLLDLGGRSAARPRFSKICRVDDQRGD